MSSAPTNPHGSPRRATNGAIAHPWADRCGAHLPERRGRRSANTARPIYIDEWAEQHGWAAHRGRTHAPFTPNDGTPGPFERSFASRRPGRPRTAVKWPRATPRGRADGPTSRTGHGALATTSCAVLP